jgi:hypothetical protein
MKLLSFSLGLMAAVQISHGAITADEARAIAREAVIYGFPLVDNYRVHHSYFVDKGNPEYKAPWNSIRNTPRVFTPEDKAMQTPNSDTPYSFVGMDLRAEPIVVTVPAIPEERYFSVQLIDAYTHNYAYIGSRTTGNAGGQFLITGPGWKGTKPEGVTKVFPCETSFAWGLIRTQLFEPADLGKVKEIQAAYKVQTLSQFLGKEAPAAAPVIDFPAPLSAEEQKTSPAFFRILDFTLRHCPVHPSEKDLRARFNQLGIGTGFDEGSLAPDILAAVKAGMGDAWKEFADFKAASIDTGKVTSGQVFGTREFLKNNYLYRMTGAVLGIYGNSREEAIYPTYFTDAKGAKLNGADGRYTLRFAPGQLPPVNSFWSLTLYELPASLLSANSLNRYLINSPMLPSLVRDTDGGITLHVQHESPGKDREPNWLPAPAGPFWMSLRLYCPKEEALTGAWKQPAAVPASR